MGVSSTRFLQVSSCSTIAINYSKTNISPSINGNVHKVTFWILAYLFYNQELLGKIQEETRPAVINDVPNVTYLLENCPRLEAIFLEVLRMVMSSSLMRFVTEPTPVGGKILRKGYNVMAPYRQLHYDKDVWGENADEFDPERFLRNKNLAKSPSYKPFGGGQYLCPGRFLARRVVFSFVALALSRFELALDTGAVLQREGGAGKGSGSVCHTQSFPRMDLSKPALGSLAPVHGDEVIVRVRPRVGA